MRSLEEIGGQKRMEEDEKEVHVKEMKERKRMGRLKDGARQEVLNGAFNSIKGDSKHCK